MWNKGAQDTQRSRTTDLDHGFVVNVTKFLTNAEKTIFNRQSLKKNMDEEKMTFENK